jgi:hypothetical protein
VRGVTMSAGIADRKLLRKNVDKKESGKEFYN